MLDVNKMTDDIPGFLSDKHVAIFGLGLMGGSLALALHGKCRILTGIDPDPEAVQAAIRRGIVDRADVQTGDLLIDADVIILAAPVNTILNLLADLPDLCPNAAMVLDFGSTKRNICEAMQSLPERFDPIGGHPMCGKETSGLENADPAIFIKAAFVLVALERSTPRVRHFAEELVRLIGSHPIWMDAITHDRQVAAISHLPFLAANALAYCTPVSNAPLAASGFASTTRLAVTSPIMIMDVLQTNQAAIVDSLHQYREHLAVLENLLSAGDFDALYALLLQGAENRNQIVQSNSGEIL
ncbi:MAG: prephenate dehydrogenase/arogenate dehydrogenase family protein [Leptolinea sp.]